MGLLDKSFNFMQSIAGQLMKFVIGPNAEL